MADSLPPLLAIALPCWGLLTLAALIWRNLIELGPEDVAFDLHGDGSD